MEEPPVDGPIALARPISATFLDLPVLILELSPKALTLLHQRPLPAGSAGTLQFAWQGEQISLDCRVLESDPSGASAASLSGQEPPSFRMELAVTALHEPCASTLIRLLRAYADEIARAQEANARGDRRANVIDGDLTLTAFSRLKAGKRIGFVTCRFVGDSWQQSFSLLSDQPLDGFTVATGEDEAAIEKLQSAYALGGDDERALIREMASISIRSQSS